VPLNLFLSKTLAGDSGLAGLDGAAGPSLYTACFCGSQHALNLAVNVMKSALSSPMQIVIE
jgi:hypothetical protein